MKKVKTQQLLNHTMVVFIFVLSSFSCQPKTSKVTFYIENLSRIDTTVTIEVMVNENLAIDKQYNYSTITPNYDISVLELPLQDSIHIKAKTDTGVKKEFTIAFDKNSFIFLSYVFDSLKTSEEKEANERIKKELNGYDPSTLLVKKALREKIQYVEPLLY